MSVLLRVHPRNRKLLLAWSVVAALVGGIGLANGILRPKPMTAADVELRDEPPGNAMHDDLVHCDRSCSVGF